MSRRVVYSDPFAIGILCGYPIHCFLNYVGEKISGKGKPNFYRPYNFSWDDFSWDDDKPEPPNFYSRYFNWGSTSNDDKSKNDKSKP